MSEISICRYNEQLKTVWNEFNRNSKMPLFMFDRNYMDYHRDRFTDHSLLFYDDDRLIAMLPACETDNRLISHGGLTYGGMISGNDMKQPKMNGCFDALIKYCRNSNIKSVTYKTIPHIYHKQPAEEDRFCLFSQGAKIEAIDVSTYINLKSPLKMNKGRKAQISKARRENVVIKELSDWKDYDVFLKIENEILESKHGTHAVHTADELKMLRDMLPDNIHLYAALKNDEIIAGVVIYEYDFVVHTQYMAANEEARQIGALDLAIATVIEKYRDTKSWLDFGISTEHGKIYLNEGLVSQKEGFGGRTGVYEIWNLPII